MCDGEGVRREQLLGEGSAQMCILVPRLNRNVLACSKYTGLRCFFERLLLEPNLSIVTYACCTNGRCEVNRETATSEKLKQITYAHTHSCWSVVICLPLDKAFLPPNQLTERHPAQTLLYRLLSFLPLLTCIRRRPRTKQKPGHRMSRQRIFVLFCRQLQEKLSHDIAPGRCTPNTTHALAPINHWK
jgi:hypothetical protein